MSDLTEQEINFLLEQFDMTEPALQRHIVAAWCLKATKAEARVQRLEVALRDLICSADSTWEEYDEGNDWREYLGRARAALEGTP